MAYETEKCWGLLEKNELPLTLLGSAEWRVRWTHTISALHSVTGALVGLECTVQVISPQAERYVNANIFSLKNNLHIRLPFVESTTSESSYLILRTTH